MRALIAGADNPQLAMIPQRRFATAAELDAELARVVAGGGEGLMLHRRSARYRPGRSEDLLKYKPHQDAEAQVVAHLPGKGKYQGMMGALQVRTPEGRRFRIGTGFTDAQRAAPPPLGAWVTYRYTGRSGLKLPLLSLGLWQNFGTDRPEDTQRAILRRAFDRGVTHFDLANNYGPPYGRAEENFGRYLREDFAGLRDELVISTKAGYDMWPGPYGQGGGSRKYVLASLDQSLARMGLDYVDIFYSHRFDPETPVEETMTALDTAVRSGRALYAGISSYSAEKTREAATIARDLGTPLLIHQPSYSMLNRWIEEPTTDDGRSLLDELGAQGMGCIVFTALAQGLLTDRYLDGVPDESRAARDDSTLTGLDDDVLERVRALNRIAERRGQKLAQLALQWALRDERVTSAVIGASSVEQLDTNLDALDAPPLSQEELAEIDKYAVDSGVNLWAKSTEE